ncbi:hypothetical protein [Achromobacter dolens]|uniref:hypothetical protein n=1 Tax=Achromobacter dolens TaxID=1287738 RepID=UPI0011A0BE61|nr:hypothetical protein [Achromobacter dolens]
MPNTIPEPAREMFAKRQMLERLSGGNETIIGLTIEEAEEFNALLLAKGDALNFPLMSMGIRYKDLSKKIYDAAIAAGFTDESISPF